MLVSVVTVCRNSASEIPGALESLRTQSHREREWVVIDGGSTDRTMEIVANSGERLGRCVSEPDGGIYDAMNKGVARAAGELVYFLNSDDRFCDANVVRDVAAVFESDAALELVFGNVIYVRPEGCRTLRTYSHINAKSLLFEDLCHQAVFARKRLFERFGAFDLRYRINADYDWLIRVFQGGARWRRMDRNFAFFNVDGAHTRDPRALAQERKQVRLQYMSPLTLLLGDLRRRVVHRWHRHLCAHPLGQIPLQ